MYAVWMKIDDTLPWIELKRDCKTRKEARKAAESFGKTLRIKAVKLDKGVRSIATVAAIKSRHHLR